MNWHVIAGILILLGIVIFIWNWKRPNDDYIPKRSESIRESKVCCGLWHTGIQAKDSFYYNTQIKALILEPNPSSEAFQHVLIETTGKKTKQEILDELKITKQKALEYKKMLH